MYADMKGEHQLSCPGGSHTQCRHNALVKLLENALKQAGFKTAREQKCGLDDNRRPGDVVAFNFEGGRCW